MKHLIKANPRTVTNPEGNYLEQLPEIPRHGHGGEYISQIEIPHFLNFQHQTGVCSMIIPSELSLEEGDMLTNEYGWNAMVIDIMERRKARGTWGERSTDFVKLRFM